MHQVLNINKRFYIATSFFIFFTCMSSCHLFESKPAKIDRLLSRGNKIVTTNPKETEPLAVYDTAFDAFYQVYQIDSSNCDALLGCSVSAYHLGKYDTSYRFADKALAIFPSNDGYYLRGACNFILGNFERSERDMDEYLKADTTSSRAAIIYLHKGQASRYLGNFNSAMQSYNKAIQMDSSEVEMFNNRGELFYTMDNMDQAYNDFKKAISLDSNSAFALHGMGGLLITIHQSIDGLVYVNKAIEREPKNGTFYRSKGYGYYNLHKIDSFCVYLHIAADLGDKDALPDIETYCKKDR